MRWTIGPSYHCLKLVAGSAEWASSQMDKGHVLEAGRQT